MGRRQHLREEADEENKKSVMLTAPPKVVKHNTSNAFAADSLSEDSTVGSCSVPTCMPLHNHMILVFGFLLCTSVFQLFSIPSHSAHPCKGACSVHSSAPGLENTRIFEMSREVLWQDFLQSGLDVYIPTNFIDSCSTQ